MAAASKRGRPTKAELERQRREKELREKRARQAAAVGIALFAVGLVLCALAFVEGQSVWRFLHDAVFGVLGVFAYFTGPLCIYTAVVVAYGKTTPAPKVLKALLLLLTVSGTVYAFSRAGVTDLAADVETAYALGVAHSGGGVLSMVLGWTLSAACGVTAARIVLIILILISVMLITGKTVVDLVNGAKRPIDVIKERSRVRREEDELLSAAEHEQGDDGAADEAQKPKKRAQIDIPVDPLPTHPEAEAKPEAADSRVPGSRIDIPIDVGTTPRPSVDEVAPAKRAKPARASAIDIPLGPDFEPADRDTGLELLPIETIRKARASGPAASVVDELLRADEVISSTFATFGPAPEEGSDAAGGGETRPETAETAVEDNPAAEEDSSPRESGGQTPALVPSAGVSAEPLRTEKPEYVFPPLSLLKRTDLRAGAQAQQELKNNADMLVETLNSFGVRTRIVDVSRGPSVTRYELQPETGVRLSRIVSLADDLALNLAASGVRIEAPIPGKAAVGIEVPNRTVNTVGLRNAIESSVFRDAQSPLTFALGMEISGEVRVGDISGMPHLLIAGSTGMGKSVCINSMIVSLVYKSSPDDLQMILIDPKMVEFTCYKGLPHLYIPVVTDPKKAAGALGSAVGEMLKRYKLFSELGVRNIGEYNAYVERRGPAADDPAEENGEPLAHKARLVIVIDELADLMMTAPTEVEDAVCRIAQMGRAAGIHLVVATQRPSVDVITGTIKNNIPSRIAFKVSSQVDSRTILDTSGAEKLIGRGDMLFWAVGQPKPVRIQGCYVSESEVAEVVGFLKERTAASYNEQFMREMDEMAARAKTKGGPADDPEEGDPMIEDAIEVVVEAGQASTSLLQRKLKLGYARAARIMDELEQRGIVGPPDGSKPRAVNMTRQQWQERMMNTAE